tara:strand:- start:11192 stop:12001 length:810 start_codon:yes stop_codon:yes gene_type:complete
VKNILFAILSLTLIYISVEHFMFNPTHFKESTLGGVIWKQAVNPGKLSQAHSFLDNDCMACHSPMKGVERQNCVVCHANDIDILERQPTSFHADISTCLGCHKEHIGRSGHISNMDHSFLSETGMLMLSKSTKADDEKNIMHSYIMELSGRDINQDSIFVHPSTSKKETLLNCASCHSNDDKHFELFGNNCVQCHRTDMWNIAEFRHPSPKSRDCIQCHQAPPSHYKMHFNMMSQKIPNRPDARVQDCFKCHQTTHWTDIKNIGKFKHH